MSYSDEDLLMPRMREIMQSIPVEKREFVSEMRPIVKLARYRCHKEVEAVKIAHIDYRHHDQGGATIITQEGHDRFYVSEAYVNKHKPRPGGYYVRYDDGYESWSPAEAFESGYTRIDE